MLNNYIIPLIEDDNCLNTETDIGIISDRRHTEDCLINKENPNNTHKSQLKPILKTITEKREREKEKEYSSNMSISHKKSNSEFLTKNRHGKKVFIFNRNEKDTDSLLIGNVSIPIPSTEKKKSINASSHYKFNSYSLQDSNKKQLFPNSLFRENNKNSISDNSAKLDDDSIGRRYITSLYNSPEKKRQIENDVGEKRTVHYNIVVNVNQNQPNNLLKTRSYSQNNNANNNINKKNKEKNELLKLDSLAGTKNAINLQNYENSFNQTNAKNKTRKIIYSKNKSISDIPLDKLTAKQKFRRVYLKITIVLLFNYIWNRMKFYGLNVLRADIEDEIQNFAVQKIEILQDEVKDAGFYTPSKIFLNPNHKFFNFWNIIRILLHIYSMTYMVYIICVLDRIEILSFWWFVDYFIELLFLADIFIIFFTGYYRHGELHTKNFDIIRNYLSRWFVVDFLGVFPFELLYSNYYKAYIYNRVNYSWHRIIRVLRFNRLYKMFQFYKNSDTIKKLIQLKSVDYILKKLKLNAGITRLINTLFIVLVLSHIFACIFYYSAKINNFAEDTWIARSNLIDHEPNVQYLSSIYFSLTVVTTVGFGDITSVTVFEKILTCLWMIIGVAFYSFVISNLSSIISSMDVSSTILEKKIETLNEFSKKLQLPDYLYLRIKKVYEENNQQYYIQDESQVLEDLPYNLKVEILFHINHGKINSIVFFLDRSINLVVDIISKWKHICYDAFEFLYLNDESPFDSK